MSGDDFLSRWSRRKIEARAGTSPAPEPPAEPAAPLARNDAVPATSPEPGTPESGPKPLPPVESLTFDSDFTAFMQPGVDSLLRRQALKTLLNDPRFNVMDGLDVYIDDYSRPDPLPEGWLEKLNQYARLGNHEPGATPGAEKSPESGQAQEDQRVAQGDAPPDEATADGEEPDTSDDGPPFPEQGQSPAV